MLSMLAWAALAAALDQAPRIDPAPSLDAQAPAISESQLAQVWGGQAQAEATSSTILSAVNAGNTVNAAGAITSGPIDLSGSALQYFAGIGNFVFNTGNNNNLEGSITVNVMMVP